MPKSVLLIYFNEITLALCLRHEAVDLPADSTHIRERWRDHAAYRLDSVSSPGRYNTRKCASPLVYSQYCIHCVGRAPYRTITAAQSGSHVFRWTPYNRADGAIEMPWRVHP
ncbi:hypothetical protein BASA60_005486 [Batrachochytrium salamandrivorans]|nr:hypothetical protein BASA60_005486 [Batrachochytrium salamandrivorans]